MIERARAGCRRAFARLWSEHEGRVRAVVARRSPPSLVEDVVQDVALAALAGIASFRAESGFDAWLLSIARNRAASAREGLRRRRERLADPALSEGAQSLDAIASDDEVLPRRGRRRELCALLRRLPRSYRLPLWLRYVNGCSAPEIAARLGTTQGTVRVALCRGLRQLRDLVPQPWLD